MAEKEMDLQKKESAAVEKAERTREGKAFLPHTDIIETRDDIVLLADMPGTDQKSIDISLKEDVLTIQAQVKERTFEGVNLVYSEYEVGDFVRSFSISDTIDREKIEASYKNGVLRLRLPKIEPAKPKTISIKVG